jgi:hypothetical protein
MSEEGEFFRLQPPKHILHQAMCGVQLLCSKLGSYRSTLKELFTDGALANNKSEIPRAIHGTLIMCERLSVPYL